MPDQVQCTQLAQSAAPEISHVFRESFVSRFQRPDHEAAVRMLAELADRPGKLPQPTRETAP